MAKRYTHPAPEERYYIKARAEAGDSRAEIARSLGRSASTVSRELKRNTGLRGYRPKQAQGPCDYRHAARRRGAGMTEAVKSHIVGKLKEDWSPEQISGCMRLEGAWVSHETIHLFVWKDKRDGGDRRALLRHSAKKRRKRCGKNDFKGPHPGQGGHLKSVRTSSTRAPASARRDGDTVVGAGHRGGLVTLAERRSRLVVAAPIQRKTKAETAQALCRAASGLEGILGNITYDNGRELSGHAAVSGATGSDAYFARPCRSRERGLNEHGGGRLRQYFPKSMPLDGITDEQVRRAVSRINSWPRKCLGFKTPVEVLQNA